MERRHFLCGCGCLGLLSAFAAVPEVWAPPARFERPLAGTDEGGLWALMEREEAKLKRSRFLLPDKTLQAYVGDIACRLAGDHCPDLRVYLVRSPHFNASMAPNGMLQVWSGLLLRMANEAQLAAVIGHEIGHYLARHSLDQLRDAKSRSAFGQFLGIALGAAGAGGAGAIAQLALVAGMFAYTRDHEREADRIGMELMARAGYPPIEAARVWEQLLAEFKGSPEDEAASRSVLFATHPPPEERETTLRQQAAGLPAGGETGEARYREMLAPQRRELLQDELRRRRPGETLVLLDRLLQSRPDDADLFFSRGEAFRLRNEGSDADQAIAAYRQALAAPSPPPETHRSLGLVQRQAGQADAARESFRQYLKARPGAEDTELIRSYLEEKS